MKVKEIVRPLGRWNFVEKPYVNICYDNCSGVESQRDRLEFETYTQGCQLTTTTPPYCKKCQLYLISKPDTEYFIKDRLHKTKCLSLN